MVDVSALDLGLIAEGGRLSNVVAAALMEDLTSGAFAPGDRLPPEREMAVRFGVSRTVVREALRLLASRGIVAIRPGAGVFVARADPSATTESLRVLLRGWLGVGYEKVHEVRETIEARVVELAAERASEAELASLDDILAQMIAAPTGEAFAAADARFHLALADLAHNELYRVILDAIGGVMTEVRRQTAYMPGARQRATDGHRRIAAALTQRDAPGARKAMEDHLAQARTTVREIDESARRPRPGDTPPS